MGRPRKPTALKILDNDRADRINISEPKSPKGLGDPPDWLDALGKQAWSRLSERLAEMGLGVRADAEAAMIYCSCYSLWLRSKAQVAKEGLTITTETTVKAHPLLVVIAENARQMSRILGQFGMNPAARSALHVREAPEGDPLMAFLAEKPRGKKSQA